MSERLSHRGQRWMLPEGIEEVLPERAIALEQLRRDLIDLWAGWGYQLVMPPLIEYLDSLLTGTGNDLELATFKLTDQMTGRTLGVRADMTPQVARIDAHCLRHEAPTRLCYIGTVLHTRTDGFAGSRSPLQAGAELYGHAGIESDLEVVQLMLRTLEAAGVGPIFLDLGHVGLFRALARRAGLDHEAEAELFDALQRKAVPEIEALTGSLGEPGAALARLVDLNGGPEVLDRAVRELGHLDDDVTDALDSLRRLVERLQARQPQLTLHLDLAELRGYRYHTGLVFAAYLSGHGQAVAQGGRYDGIGRVFGRERPATGFSTDLHTLAAHSSRLQQALRGGIFAPSEGDVALERMIEALREAGETVVRALPRQAGAAQACGCDRELVMINESWTVRPVAAAPTGV